MQIHTYIHSCTYYHIDACIHTDRHACLACYLLIAVGMGQMDFLKYPLTAENGNDRFLQQIPASVVLIFPYEVVQTSKS